MTPQDHSVSYYWLYKAYGSQSSSCQSIKFPSYGNYSQLCGWVVGYQYTSPDAIDTVYITST